MIEARARIRIPHAVRAAAWIVLAAGCAGAPPAAHYIRLGEAHRSHGTVHERLLSQRILEEGLRAHPDDTDLLVELGKTYYAQAFYGDAERVFSAVLSREPRRCEAHRYLGANAFRKWKSVQSYTDYLAPAIEHLRRAVACDPEDRDSYFKLAFSGYATGDTTLALETCHAFRARHPDAPEPLFLAGAIAFDSKRWESGGDLFREALDLLPEEERAPYADIGLLLTSRQDAKQYEEATPDERVDLQRLYWLEHDPDPTTEINERRLEHVYRTFLAEARFSSMTPRLRGWETERGRALIKFGPPVRCTTTLRSIRPWDGRTEVWTYTGARGAFDLCFRDEYLNGNYIVPMSDDLSARALFVDPPLTGFAASSRPLGAAIDLTSFRETDVSCAVYLSFSVPDDTLRNSLWTWRIGSFVSRTAFFGEDGTARASYSRTIPADSLPVHALDGAGSRRFIAKYELPFDAYRVAHCFEDERGLARSLLWSHANTTRFIGASLVLSDILLHTEAADGSGPFLERSGKRYFPNPACEFGRSEPLRLYLEIYNLDVRQGASAFDVTYSIHPVRAESPGWRKLGGRVKSALLGGAGTEPVISQSFQRIASSQAASEELAVDIGALPDGDYVLTASVRDAHSGLIATRSKSFVKLARNAD
jgi:GWxTD domain-containing protein